MATAGKVAPTPKDKFVNGTAYDKLDVVEYNGTLYIAKKASAGVLPTDTEYWMLAVDLTGKLDTTGDTENNTVTFESDDEADPTAWKDVATLASKEKHSSLFNKISTMFSNVRYLYKILGSTDISALGTVTQAIATLNGNVGSIKGISSSAAITTQGQYALDAREKNASVDGTLANQLSIINSNLIKVEKIEVTVTTKADTNSLGGYYAYIGNIKSTKGNHLVTIPIGSVSTDMYGIGGVICKYHKDIAHAETYTLNAPTLSEYRCDFICLYTE